MKDRLQPRRKEMSLNASLQSLGVSQSFDKILIDRQATNNVIKLASERMLGVYGKIDDDSRSSLTRTATKIEQDLFLPQDVKAPDGSVLIPAADVQSQAVTQIEQLIRTASIFNGSDLQIQVFPASQRDHVS